MIPLSIPSLNGNEWKYIKECLDTNWVSSVGSYVTLFEEKVAEFVGSKYAVATSNGTAALHVSLLLSGVEKNDYVIVPNITFIASINSIKYCNADPILIDVDSETWQLDLDLLEQFLKEETVLDKGTLLYKKNKRRIKCMMPVHVLGNMCDMVKMSDLADKYGLKIVEDATESLGTTLNGQSSGTFGEFGCFSFNGNKIITTGGGGIIVTDNEMLAKKAKHITTQAKSDPLEYVHDEIGFNYRLVNILAAMGVAQMEQLPKIIERKKEIAAFYYDALGGIEGLEFQKINKGTDVNQWLFTIKLDDSRAILKKLIHDKIQARPFWVPMNQLRMFKDDIYYNHYDKSDQVYKSCLSIPCSSGITDMELDKVVRAIVQ